MYGCCMKAFIYIHTDNHLFPILKARGSELWWGSSDCRKVSIMKKKLSTFLLNLFYHRSYKFLLHTSTSLSESREKRNETCDTHSQLAIINKWPSEDILFCLSDGYLSVTLSLNPPPVVFHRRTCLSLELSYKIRACACEPNNSFSFSFPLFFCFAQPLSCEKKK